MIPTEVCNYSLRRTTAVVAALLAVTTLCFSQSYIELGITPGISTFRDNATSPLFYTGEVLTLSGSFHTLNKKNELVITANYTNGKHKNQFNNTSNSSYFHSIEASLALLYPVWQNIGKKLILHTGGTLVNTFNIRDNKALMNNSFGAENITNILLSGKISKSLLTSKGNRGAFFIKTDLGIINVNFRPGYAYNYMPEIDRPSINTLSDYSLSINGMRFIAATGFMGHLSNGNIISVSYIFDAYTAPGKYEPFDYARHSVKFAIMFNFR